MDCILGMDVGGTNTSIGIFDKKLNQLLSFKYSTKHVHPYKSLSQAAAEAKKKGMTVTAAGIAVAGPVKDGKAHLTNAGISLSLEKFKKNLKIKNAVMLNDFEAVAYGLNAIGKNDILALTKNKPLEKSVKVVLGAGTGLGKAVLYFNEKKGFHVPLRAEEGHTAIAVATKEEFSLMEFIKKRKKADVVWEDILSGRGIANVYDFLSQKKRIKSSISSEIASYPDKASIIAKYRKTDTACKEAFAVFARIYARFIRNSMLAALPYGGVYIAGGIAMKNPDILTSKEFKKELYKKAVYSDIVKKIPLFLITNRGIGMKGAAFCALNESQNKLPREAMTN